MNKRVIIPVLLICCLGVFCSCATTGATPSQTYFEAENSYKKLQDQPQKQKYRSYWLKCIQQFESVYAADKVGKWAAAGLFMSGKLYREMYGQSYKAADRNTAETIFRQVVREFPESAYRAKAEQELKAMGVKPSGDGKSARGKAELDLKRTGSRPADAGTAEKAARQYVKAESAYNALKAASGKHKYRTYWLDCIRKFEAVHDLDPEGPWAAAGLYMTAQTYRDLYSHSYKPSDRQAADDIFRRIVREYPSSDYRGRAEAALGNAPQVAKDTIRGLTSGATTSGEIVSSGATANGSGMATVTGIRYWSNPEYTRIVIDASRETGFQNNLLNKDPSQNKLHQRLYVDFANSRLGERIEKMIPIDDTLLKDVRAGQYTSDTVRVVVDIKSFENYNIFSLKNPFRIVIDVRGKAQSTASGDPSIPSIDWNTPNVSIARQLALGVRRIVIDPGHGGKDCGAPGAVRGIHEKHVVMEIAQKLAKKIRDEIGCEVFFTRHGDEYLTLEERTAIANTEKADLFISIHANASRNQNAYGIETYFLNLTTDNESIAVAARENATSEKNISELQTILNDLMRNAKVNESSRLATYVQGELCGGLAKKYPQINNKGVKQAPFYVLLGAQMPAILVETAFISNSRECRRLMDRKYQEKICDGIVQGIRRYIDDTRPTPFISTEATPGINP